jgi:hypothetical protein
MGWIPTRISVPIARLFGLLCERPNSGPSDHERPFPEDFPTYRTAVDFR